MFDISWLLPPLLGLSLGIFGVSLWITQTGKSVAKESARNQALIASMTPPHHSLFPTYNELVGRTQVGTQTNFCADCGQAMISLRRQDGFDPDKGTPAYTYERACPDYVDRGPQMSQPFGTYCGKRKFEDPMPNAHNHPDPTQMHTDCPPCIDVMLADHIIDDAQATELYKVAGLTPTLKQLEAAFRPTAMLTPPFSNGKSKTRYTSDP